jgi:hypothetical protein
VAGQDWPDRVDGSQVGTLCYEVEAIVGALVGNESSRTIVAKLVFHFADGTSEEMPLQFNQNIYSVRGGNGEVANRRPWAASNPNLRLTYLSWRNPNPGKEVAHIDFVSTMTQAAPFLVAISVK